MRFINLSILERATNAITSDMGFVTKLNTVLTQALSYLPNLEELFVSGNGLRKLTDLHRCKKLQELDLSRNLITDLSTISGLPALQVCVRVCVCV